MLEQVSNLPCGKIVLSQSYDYIFETLPPGMSWTDYGFFTCITTNEEQKNFISQYMKNVNFKREAEDIHHLKKNKGQLSLYNF